MPVTRSIFLLIIKSDGFFFFDFSQDILFVCVSLLGSGALKTFQSTEFIVLFIFFNKAEMFHSLEIEV